MEHPASAAAHFPKVTRLGNEHYFTHRENVAKMKQNERKLNGTLTKSARTQELGD